MRPRSRVHSPDHDLRLLLPAIATLGASITLSIDLLTYKGVGYDLAAYILAARRLLAGEPLYPTEIVVLGPAGQFVYPPPVALLFAPLGLLPFDPVRAGALVILTALGALLTVELVRHLPRRSRYWAAAGMVVFFPLVWEVGLENLTLVTVVLCLGAWKLRRLPGLSGACFAIALGLKLLPLVLIAYLALARRWGILLWSLGATALVVVLTWPVVAAEWAAFLSLLTRIGGGPPGSGSNIVPVIFSAPALRPVLPALAVAIAAICGLVSRGRGDREEHAFRVALAASPLLAATLWYPYLIFALPLLITTGPTPPRSILRLPFALARPAAWLLMQAQVVKDPGRDFILPLVGLLLLLVVGLLELAWMRSPRPRAAASAGSPSPSAGDRSRPPGEREQVPAQVVG